MPIYEYRCSQCGHELEALQRLSEAPLVNCPACGKDALTKLVSAAGFQLKGSGWYATDFRGAGSGKQKDADKPAADTKTDSAKSDTPAAKNESTATTASTSTGNTKAA